MFGYVYPSKIDLTFRDFFKFRAYYCGVCKSLKKNYGEFSRLCLNYDITFLALLLSSVYTDSENPTYEKCIVSPLKNKKIIINEYTEYCASINILLAYNKLLDNYVDDKSLAALIGSKLFKKNYIIARNKYPEKEMILKKCLKELSELELKGKSSIDDLSEIFAKTLAELFVYNSNDKYSESLRKIGFYIGKYIYILDCFDDLSDDIKKKRFNPLILENLDNINSEIKKKIDLILVELEKQIQQLELKQSKEIIYNIIKLGLQNKAKNILYRKTCKV